MKHLLLFIAFSWVATAQTKSAQTSGACSPIPTGNNNTVTLTCYGVDRTLAGQISQLVITSKRDSKTLREILAKVTALRGSLEAREMTIISTTGPQSPITTGPNSPITINPDVNPNALATTYDCEGNSRKVGPTSQAALSINMNVGANIDVFNKMIDLYNGRKYKELKQLCASEIETAPGWLTANLFCGAAHLALGEREEAKSELAFFDAKTGPAYGTGTCKQVSDFLHQNL